MSLNINYLLELLLSLNPKRPSAVFAYAYNVLNNTLVTLDNDEENTGIGNLRPHQLTSTVNNEAFINGYSVGSELYELSIHLKTLRDNDEVKLRDFGITSLMMCFADFYTKGQYPLFVDAFRNVPELERLESFLLKYNKSRIMLPLDMATDPKYGIKKNLHRFQGNNQLLTMEAFEDIVLMMHTPKIKPEQFIGKIAKYHLHVVESFYNFTSITKHCKVIKECRDLHQQSLNYTFPKPILSYTVDAVSDCDYWFILPQRVVWFAYHSGSIKYSTYISRDTNRLLESVFSTRNLNCIVVGIVVDSTTMYPLYFESAMHRGNWHATVETIKMLGLNCIYRPGPPPPLSTFIANPNNLLTNAQLNFIKKLYTKQFYFVKRTSNQIYKRVM